MNRSGRRTNGPPSMSGRRHCNVTATRRVAAREHAISESSPVEALIVAVVNGFPGLEVRCSGTPYNEPVRRTYAFMAAPPGLPHRRRPESRRRQLYGRRRR
jgi:hypothetical protein